MLVVETKKLGEKSLRIQMGRVWRCVLSNEKRSEINLEMPRLLLL